MMMPFSAYCRRPPRARMGRAGFSLLEVMLAVALATMLLVAVNFFVLSMGELWSGGSESRLFDRHVRGVARFLESLVNQSVVLEEKAVGAATGSTTSVPPRRNQGLTWSSGLVPRRPAIAMSNGAGLGWGLGMYLAQAMPGGDPGGRGRLPIPVRNAGPDTPPAIGPEERGRRPDQRTTDSIAATGPRFRFGTPSGYDGSPPMLMFEVDEAPGQCVWPDRPLPQVECALQINGDEGLVLLWKSKLEEDYGEARPRKTQLSPFGQAMSFDYYDAQNQTWQHTEQPLADGQGGWLVPQRLRVTFAYHGRSREISVTLPDTPGGAPLR